MEPLEPRTLLTVGASPILSAASMAPVPSGSAWNIQLAPGDSAELSTITTAIKAAGATIGTTPVSGLYVASGSPTAMAVLGPELSNLPGVSAAPEHNMQSATVPNDPNYINGKQWQLNGTYGINAPAAWSLTVGSNSVVVAVVDSGLNYNLADMYTNVWLNQAEIPSTVMPNLTDVNHDGLITFSDLNNAVNQGPGKIVNTNPGTDSIITGADVLASTSVGGWASSPGSTQDGALAYPNDFIGWNFVNSTNNPMDANGHGTFTAGEIGAVGNNGVGVTGEAWRTQVMPVAFLDSTGTGTDTAAASAIDYAVNHGAKVINASWGGSGIDPTIASALQYADQHNVIVVCAAGNNGSNDDTTFFAPASYSSAYPNVISVAAISNNGTLASWSNYGISTVQLAAPGVNVYSLKSNGSDGTMSGTSMAAPLVTGAVALVESAHPSWSMSEVISAVLDHTTPDPNLAGKVTTGGILNVGAAVNNTIGPRVTRIFAGGAITASSGLDGINVQFNEEVNPSTFGAGQVTLTGPGGASIAVKSVSAVSGSNDHQFLIAFAGQFAPGDYKVTIAPTVSDLYGNELNQAGSGANGQSSYSGSVAQLLSLQVSGLPSSATAGTPQTFTVQAVNATGTVDTYFVGTLDFSSSDPLASLPASYTFTSADAGSHSFNVTFETSGTQTLDIVDPNATKVATSQTVSVAGSTAQKPTITWTTPASITYGTALSSTQLDATASAVVNGSTVSVAGTFTYSPAAGTVLSVGTNTLSVSFTPNDTSAFQIATATTQLTVNQATPTITWTTPASITYGTALSSTQLDATASAVVGGSTVSVAGTFTYSPAAGTVLSVGTNNLSVSFKPNDSNDYGTASASTKLVVVSSGTNSASYIGQDATTQGNWIGTYGSQGYVLPGATSNLPSYASVSVSNEYYKNFSVASTDPRTLQESGTTNRSSGSWIKNDYITINLNLTDGQAHKLSLYAADWNSCNRSEQFQLIDPATGTVLDTETLANFTSGDYLSWTVSGHVLIKVTNLTTGPNLLVSGLFLDAADVSSNSATYLGQDTTTQGNWTGTYGSQGYVLPGVASNLPSYASVSVSNEYYKNFSIASTDPRTLQEPGTTNRSSGSWIKNDYITINLNLTDGQAHKLSLYAADWNSCNRSEQFQIIDPATGAVLDTETLANFTKGDYLSWTVSGHIMIRVTNLTTGPNLLVSGLFLDAAGS